MLRAMVFIDFENFDISKYNYYRAKCLEDAKSAALAAGTPVPTHVQTVVPKLDFNKIPKEVVNLLSNPHTLVKSIISVCKIRQFLFVFIYWFSIFRCSCESFRNCI